MTHLMTCASLALEQREGGDLVVSHGTLMLLKGQTSCCLVLLPVTSLSHSEIHKQQRQILCT